MLGGFDRGTKKLSHRIYCLSSHITLTVLSKAAKLPLSVHLWMTLTKT